MPYKTCPACQQVSYSAAGDNIWICPCCGDDISMVSSSRTLGSLVSLAGKRRPANVTSSARLPYINSVK